MSEVNWRSVRRERFKKREKQNRQKRKVLRKIREIEKQSLDKCFVDFKYLSEKYNDDRNNYR